MLLVFHCSGRNDGVSAGSLEFLDDGGEWHFDPSDRTLYLIPPKELQVHTAAALEAMPLVLTQTDNLLTFAGDGVSGATATGGDSSGRGTDGSPPSSSSGRVRHVHVVNLTLAHTSAQFFMPHEETSGYGTETSFAEFFLCLSRALFN
jgi:hypothetical protein